jgi:hypothetical protein
VSSCSELKEHPMGLHTELKKSGCRRRNVIKDTSEQVHKKDSGSTSAKVYPVIGICHGCHLTELKPVPIQIHVVIIHVT